MRNLLWRVLPALGVAMPGQGATSPCPRLPGRGGARFAQPVTQPIDVPVARA